MSPDYTGWLRFELYEHLAATIAGFSESAVINMLLSLFQF